MNMSSARESKKINMKRACNQTQRVMKITCEFHVTLSNKIFTHEIAMFGKHQPKMNIPPGYSI